MPHPFPPPDARFPLILPDGTPHEGTVFRKAVIDRPQFTAGDYSYASVDTPPTDWLARLAPYLFPQSTERLILGKFCQIADGATFVTASANHRKDGFSTYPFAVFDGGFDTDRASLPGGGPDTVLGHDVWLGRNVTVLPGARLGDGVIVGTGAVEGGVVPPYAVVASNPGRVVRLRFVPDTVARLQQIAWWDLPIEAILTHESAICGADLAVVEAAATQIR